MYKIIIKIEIAYKGRNSVNQMKPRVCMDLSLLKDQHAHLTLPQNNHLFQYQQQSEVIIMKINILFRLFEMITVSTRS